MRLENKIALIAGAGSGMGRATALLFAKEGARVGVIARDPQKGEESAARIIEAGGEAMGLAGDLTRRAEAEKAVEAMVSRWGGLNILYYGAGGFSGLTRNLRMWMQIFGTRR
jgi:NAD(P)-dependent dehydrogenase (short-subunit alcohol dehydrogenase family)